ncbi:MAG TPA: cardiolipin synthase ClsB [Rhodocyclaceae bacterium]|nr:cardiolipin synthase ClsB [Rhodocyclaceae bacterium]
MKATFVGGNRITLLENGSDYFPALIAAIDRAASEIHLESYIFADDATGRAVASALARAAQRGVVTRVLVDGFGAPDFLATLGRDLIAQAAEVQIYRPEVARLRLRRHRLRRLHRKLAVIDRRIAFIGGINVIDDMDAPHQMPPRFDYAVAIEGPLLEPIHRAARHLWHLVRWASFRHRVPEVAVVSALPPPCGDMEAAFVLRDNLRHRRDIEEAYLDAIEAARSEVVLANAYFLPGRRFRHALMAAAARGVRVVVLLQGRVEYVLLHYATQALYGSLIGAGISVVEYRLSFLHAKVAVIDGHWATVGSSNIDPFSLLLAREANVVVRDAGFARTLRHSLEQAISQGSTPIEAADLKKRSLFLRAASWLAYSVVRLAVGIAGYGGRREYRG